MTSNKTTSSEPATPISLSGIKKSSPGGRGDKPLPPPKPPRLLPHQMQHHHQVQPANVSSCSCSDILFEEDEEDADLDGMRSAGGGGSGRGSARTLLHLTCNVQEVYDDTSAAAAANRFPHMLCSPKRAANASQPDTGNKTPRPTMANTNISQPDDTIQLPERFLASLKRSPLDTSNDDDDNNNRDTSGGGGTTMSLPVATDNASLADDLQVAVKWLKQEILQLKLQDKQLYRQFLEVGAKINHLKHYPAPHRHHHYSQQRPTAANNFNPLKSLPDRHLLDASVISLPDFLTRHAGLELSIHSPSTGSLGNWSAAEEEDEYDLDDVEQELDEDDTSEPMGATNEGDLSFTNEKRATGEYSTSSGAISVSQPPRGYQSIRSSTPNLSAARPPSANGQKLVYTFSETSL